MSYSQRETPILAELCTYLVEDVYGELAARAFSLLARYGRQRLRDIVEISYLNRRQISYGLVILIQQHLVFHSPSEASLTYYEIDWQQSYALVRYGKTSKLVEDRYGQKASNVMSNLLALGHTRIADLKDAYFPPDDSDDESDDEIVNGTSVKRRADGTRVNGIKVKGNGAINDIPSELEDAKSAPDALVNGDSNTNGAVSSVKVNGTSKSSGERREQEDNSIESPDELYAIIERLMEQGWIMKVEEAQYLSAGDFHNIARQRALDEGYGGVAPTGTKDKEKVAAATMQHKRSIRDAWLEVPQFPPRAGSDYGTSNKRAKINGTNKWSGGGGSSNGVASRVDDLAIRVNPEKVAVAMRTHQLVQIVEQRHGYVTAHIYQIMLRKLEGNLPRCYEEYPDPPLADYDDGADSNVDSRLLVTAQDVERRAKGLDICEGLDPHAITQITNKGIVEKSGVLSQPVDPSQLRSDERTRIIDKHIQLLSEDPFHFVTWHSRAGFSQWRVELDELAKSLIQHEIENTILSRKGTLGVKLLRALKRKGKLDERQTCQAMMMSANDIRGIVNDLTVQGFVQTQEIPKVERREAKHSIHLIWYDRQRAREKLLHDTYKGMIRILQRIAFEREKVQPLLTKAERSDVVGNEAKYLNKVELTALKKWKDVQEKLLLQLFREDELVATLRDLIGPLISA